MPYPHEEFLAYQAKKRISDANERRQAQENMIFSGLTYCHFKCSGPVTEAQKMAFRKYIEATP